MQKILSLTILLNGLCIICEYFVKPFFMYFEKIFVCGFVVLCLCCFCFVLSAFACMLCIFMTYSTSYCCHYKLKDPWNVCVCITMCKEFYGTQKHFGGGGL
jgi:hypothetical protein